MSQTGSHSVRRAFVNGMRQAERPTGPFLAIVISLAALLIGQLPVLAFGLRDISGGIDTTTQLVLTLSFAGPLLILLAWVRFKERRPLRSLGFFASAGRSVGVGAAVGLGFCAVIVLLNAAFGQATLGAVDLRAIGPILLLLIGFAVQGSTEEIFFRGYLLQATAAKWGVVGGMIAQSVLFTMLHGGNGELSLWSLLNLVLVAVFLGLWALADGSLWGPCAFHTFWNWSQGNVFGADVSNLSVSTSLLHFSPKAGAHDALTGGSFGLEGSALATMLLLAGCIVAWRVNASRNLPH